MRFISTGKTLLRNLICLLALMVASSSLYADSFLGPAGEEDTILIEKEANTKIPYHLILKKFSNRMFQFDTEHLISFGKGRSDHIVRSFADIRERFKTRVNVDRDEVKLNMSVNF